MTSLSMQGGLFRALVLALAAFLGACGAEAPPGASSVEAGATAESSAEAPIPVKVVVVTMFEIGEDTGDQAAEFQLWKERRNLDTVFPFPAFHDLHFDSENGVLVMVTGIGTARSTGSVMMLGMDPRFDLSEAYCALHGRALRSRAPRAHGGDVPHESRAHGVGLPAHEGHGTA